LLPFLAIIADPQGSPALAYVAPVLDIFGTNRPGRAIYVLTGLFALAALVSAGLRLALLWAGNSLVYGVSYELGVRLYENALYEPYVVHIQRNSSEIIAAIHKAEILSSRVLVPLMNGAAALVIAAFI